MTKYTVHYRDDREPESFEHHTMYRRDGVYVFERKGRWDNRRVEIPMSAVLKVERNG